MTLVTELDEEVIVEEVEVKEEVVAMEGEGGARGTIPGLLRGGVEGKEEVVAILEPCMTVRMGEGAREMVCEGVCVSCVGVISIPSKLLRTPPCGRVRVEEGLCSKEVSLFSLSFTGTIIKDATSASKCSVCSCVRRSAHSSTI